MKKAIINFIKKLCRFQIIMGKTTLVSLEVMEDLDKINKGFQDKLKKAEDHENTNE